MSRALRSAASVFAWTLAAAALGNTYTVTNTNDSGAGSLRQAILDANANPGADTIDFDIPAAGVQTITPATQLPAITSPVTTNGFSQPGSSANSNGPLLGDNSVHLVVIDGSAITTDGLVLAAGSDGSTIRGLVLNHWYGRDITISSGGNTVAGNFLGTDAAGTTALPGSLGNSGVFVLASSGLASTIGGTDPADRNLISGHSSDGISLYLGVGTIVAGNFIGTDATGTLALPNNIGVDVTSGIESVIGGTASGAGNLISGNATQGIYVPGVAESLIQGNLIGTDVTGTNAIPNANGPGIFLGNASGVTIGGAAPGARNVISGNGQSGITADNGGGDIIQGNYIGTDITGTQPLGNAFIGASFGGIYMNGASNMTIGGPNPGEGNVIAFNLGNGVTVYGLGTETGNTIRGNSIYGQVGTSFFHAQLAIDLADDGPTRNDPLDADSGSNGLQNYPIVVTAAPVSAPSSGTHVTGVLHSAPSTTYALDFYASPGCIPHPHDFYEGQTYLGAANATTDGSGTIAFDVVVAGTMDPDAVVIATATDPAGDTSEMSPRIVFSIVPGSGPAAGGTAVAIHGTEFEDGAVILVGGQALQDSAVMDDHTITGNSPALAPGTVNDVTVQDPDGIAGTLVKGFVTDFLDVPPGQQFHAQVTTLVANAITAGVGGGLYGVDQPTLRQQMAVFLLKAEHGLCWSPPPCTGVFSDVPCPSTFAPWIEQLASEGITGGCGGSNYCPSNPVRRDQMAVFLLKAEHGSSYVPPDCTGVFPDVPCPSTFADWIEQLATEAITGGCGGGNYCPQNANTRGQMAVFLVKTFALN